jgi:signal transduction histidine kinase
MTLVTILLLILVVQLTIFGVLGYVFWKKFGKNLVNMFKMVKNMNNSPFNGQKLPNLDNIKQQMSIFNDLMKKNYKK